MVIKKVKKVAEEMQVAEEMAIVVQEVVKMCCLLSFTYDDC